MCIYIYICPYIIKTHRRKWPSAADADSQISRATNEQTVVIIISSSSSSGNSSKKQRCRHVALQPMPSIQQKIRDGARDSEFLLCKLDIYIYIYMLFCMYGYCTYIYRYVYIYIYIYIYMCNPSALEAASSREDTEHGGTSKRSTSQGIGRQGIVLKHRNSLQKSQCPVAICPYLCSSERSHSHFAGRAGVSYIHMHIYIYI